MNFLQKIRRYVGIAPRCARGSETPSQRSVRFQSRQIPLLLLHAAQLVLAIILMGLGAYNIHFVAYQVLAVCLVIDICTILIATYLIICRIRCSKLCRHYSSLLLQVCMLVASVIALGLLASLAQYWKQPECTYRFKSGYQCSPYGKRDLRIQWKRDTTSYVTYSGALITGSVLSASEATSIAFFDKWADLRPTSQTNKSPPPQVQHTEQAMPLATPASQRCPLAEVWDSSTQLPTAHRSRPEPILPDEDDDYADREPEPLTPAQMRFGVTNQEHRPLSTPGYGASCAAAN
ncbi:predicted protein [Plenodomus lingam JN3]|uniref:Predicted protein n=1 Tax=Leptosphaeria maculans (strain JN3 / isolate v23.1.3 / race Av1-4-5-6-7-8) TaxID=985895 RepID=E4ZUI7_LEPMJ|nr:predicted protein [Plenodomus lingam JN3]CBX95066.1 predicted protein [Plenodomus lingam JN3]